MLRACEQIVIKSWKGQLAGPGSATRLAKRTGGSQASIAVRRRSKHDSIIAPDPAHAWLAIHERGGQTGPHIIEARNAQALRFVGADGSIVFRRRVNHPGSKFPPRPHRDPAAREAMPAIQKELEGAAERILQAAQLAKSKEWRTGHT